MARKINAMVGVRIPPLMLELIDREIEKGSYASRSDWVRSACREYYEQKLKKMC